MNWYIGWHEGMSCRDFVTLDVRFISWIILKNDKNEEILPFIFLIRYDHCYILKFPWISLWIYIYQKSITLSQCNARVEGF